MILRKRFRTSVFILTVLLFIIHNAQALPSHEPVTTESLELGIETIDSVVSGDFLDSYIVSSNTTRLDEIVPVHVLLPVKDWVTVKDGSNCRETNGLVSDFVNAYEPVSVVLDATQRQGMQKQKREDYEELLWIKEALRSSVRKIREYQKSLNCLLTGSAYEPGCKKANMISEQLFEDFYRLKQMNESISEVKKKIAIYKSEQLEGGVALHLVKKDPRLEQLKVELIRLREVIYQSSPLLMTKGWSRLARLLGFTDAQKNALDKASGERTQADKIVIKAAQNVFYKNAQIQTNLNKAIDLSLEHSQLGYKALLGHIGDLADAGMSWDQKKDKNLYEQKVKELLSNETLIKELLASTDPSREIAGLEKLQSAHDRLENRMKIGGEWRRVRNQFIRDSLLVTGAALTGGIYIAGTEAVSATRIAAVTAVETAGVADLYQNYKRTEKRCEYLRKSHLSGMGNEKSAEQIFKCEDRLNDELYFSTAFSVVSFASSVSLGGLVKKLKGSKVQAKVEDVSSKTDLLRETVDNGNEMGLITNSFPLEVAIIDRKQMKKNYEQMRGPVPNAARGPKTFLPHSAVHVVVPVYRELDNGNIFRLLQSFTRQSADVDQFKLVLLINNTPEIAQNGGPVFIENQKTLQLVRYLTGESSSVPDFLSGLPKWQQKVIADTKTKGIQIELIDASTDGIEKSEITYHGVRSTLRKLYRDDRDELIALMAADTTVPSDYIKKINSYFEGSEVDALKLNMGFNAMTNGSSTPLMPATTYQFRYDKKWIDFNNTLFTDGTNASAPQIVAKASVFDKSTRVDGHEEMIEIYNSDWRLSRNIYDNVKYKEAYDIEVTTTDRLRVGGRNNYHREKTLKDGSTVYNTHTSPTRKMLTTAFHSLYKKYGKYITKSQLKSLFEFYNFNFNSKEWSVILQEIAQKNEKKLGKTNNQESYNKRYFRNMMYAILEYSKKEIKPEQDMLDFLRRHLDEGEYQEIQKRIQKVSTQHQTQVDKLESYVAVVMNNLFNGKKPLDSVTDNKIKEFFNVNPWAKEYFQKLSTNTSSVDEALGVLREEFPDWFKSFDETPFKRATNIVDIITKFMQEGKSHPGRYPSLNKLLVQVNDLPEKTIASAAKVRPALDKAVDQTVDQYKKGSRMVKATFRELSGRDAISHIGINNVSIKKLNSSPEKYTFRINDRDVDLGDSIIDLRDVEKNSFVTDSIGQRWFAEEADFLAKIILRKESETGPVKMVAIKKLQSNAYIYDLNVKVGVAKTQHKIKVVVPVESDGAENLKAIERIKKEVSTLPPNYIIGLKEIILYSKGAPVHYSFLGEKMNVHGFASAVTREIGFFPIGFVDPYIRETFKHEFGHIVDFHNKIISNRAAWAEAMEQDKLTGYLTHVSNYAKSDNLEDFAETVMWYLLTDGGKKSPLIRGEFRNRFELLDEVFDANPQFAIDLTAEVKDKLMKKGIIVGVGGGVFVTHKGVTHFFAPEEGE